MRVPVPGYEDVVELVKCVIEENLHRNKIIKINSPHSVSPIEIADFIGEQIKIKPRYEIVARGGVPPYDTKDILELCKKCHITMEKEYWKRIIKIIISRKK